MSVTSYYGVFCKNDSYLFGYSVGNLSWGGIETDVFWLLFVNVGTYTVDLSWGICRTGLFGCICEWPTLLIFHRMFWLGVNNKIKFDSAPSYLENE